MIEISKIYPGTHSRWALALLAVLCVSSSGASEPAYIFVDLSLSNEIYSVARGVSAGHQSGETTWNTGGPHWPEQRTHAMLWLGAGCKSVDLNPPKITNSMCLATTGFFQVGAGDGHALLWHGSATNVVDLHPPGYSESIATAAFGEYQFGYARPTSGLYHAAMWRGSAATFSDLHPTGYFDSYIEGANGEQQIGTAHRASPRAILWRGTASSAIDLTPAGYWSSVGYGVGGGQQVGYVSPTPGSRNRAALWTGTADSFVDLHPESESESSFATGSNGWMQVGGVTKLGGTLNHATAWYGTANSAVDLHRYVTWKYRHSVAKAVGEDGVIVGIVQEVFNEHAALWVPVIHPALRVARSGGSLVIEFSTLCGISDQLESTSRLEGEWTKIGTPVMGTGETATVHVNINPNHAQSLFRVRRLR